MITRRTVLRLGGGLLAAPFVAHFARSHGDGLEIGMRGTSDGARTWFDPIGIHVQPGQVIRWINLDAGNSHTATAYAARIPAGVTAWDSDYLLPEEAFAVTLTEPGVYDYFCRPHEHAGMVGRIVVGTPPVGWTEPPAAKGQPPAAALRAFPNVARILADGIVRLG